MRRPLDCAAAVLVLLSGCSAPSSADWGQGLDGRAMRVAVELLIALAEVSKEGPLLFPTP